jgi:hypothetical protein
MTKGGCQSNRPLVRLKHYSAPEASLRLFRMFQEETEALSTAGSNGRQWWRSFTRTPAGASPSVCRVHAAADLVCYIHAP